MKVKIMCWSSCLLVAPGGCSPAPASDRAPAEPVSECVCVCVCVCVWQYGILLHVHVHVCTVCFVRVHSHVTTCSTCVIFCVWGLSDLM